MKDVGFQGVASTALLLRLQALLSPAFPIGAFSYSSGLEAAVEAGEAEDAATLSAWLRCWLEEGPGRSDAVFVACAASAAAAQDWTALEETAALARVFAPSQERRLEARAQGAAFLKAARGAHPWACAEAQAEAEHRLGEEPAYSAAFGAWAGGLGTDPATAGALFLHASVGNLISAGQRLRLLGQMQGQSLLSELAEPCERIAREAAEASLEDIGGAMVRGDMASMRHETQRVRVFRT